LRSFSAWLWFSCPRYSHKSCTFLVLLYYFSPAKLTGKSNRLADFILIGWGGQIN
jgi:hypothetical protein